MIKSKLALMIDSIFISFLLSLTINTWLRKIYKSANLFCFFLILLTLLLFCLILNLFLKGNNKKLFKNNNEKFLKDSLKFLIMSDSSAYIDYLCKLINCKHVEDFLFKKNDNFLYINLKTPLSASDYFKVQERFIEYKNADSKLFFIYNIKEKSFDDVFIFSSLNAKIFTSEIILKLMKEKNHFPIKHSNNTKLSLKKKLANYTKLKTNNITKSHFKEFLFSGISLLFLSIVAPYSTLYLIIGTLLISLSIISLFKKDFTKKDNDSNFLFN